MGELNLREHTIPKVPPARTRKLTAKEQQLKSQMVETAKRFSKDPEMAICKKVGLGACFEF